MTREEAERLVGRFDGWAFHPIRDTAFVVSLGDEIHCWRRDEAKGRWLTRQDIESIVGPIIRQYGHVVTKVRADNFVGQKFVKRMGFKETGVENGCITYRAERMKHARL